MVQLPLFLVVGVNMVMTSMSSIQKVGPVTRKLYDELTGIQFGDVEAEGWID